MKKILANLAKQFRRFTANSYAREAKSIPAFSPQGSEKDGFESPIKIASAAHNVISSTASIKQSNQTRPTISKLNNAGVSPDFITRQELDRELDLLRRLIESRK